MTSLQELIENAVQDRGLIYTAIGNLGNTILGAIFWFILASIVKVSEYGLVNYIIASAVIPASIAVLGLNTTVTTFLAKGYKDIVYESNSIILIFSIMASVATFLLYGFEAALITAALMYFTMSIAMLVGSKRFDEYAATIIVERIIQIISSIVLYIYMGAEGILVGYALGPLITSYRYFTTLRHFTLKFSQVKEKIFFTIHSYGLTITQTFSLYLDKIIVGALFGFTVLGLYQLAFQFLMLIMVIPSILFTYMLPQEASGSHKREIKYLGIAISIMIFLLMVFGSPIAIPILFPSYIDSIILIQIMSIAIIPVTIVSVINAKLLGNENSRLAFEGGLAYLISLAILLPSLGFILNSLGLAFAVVLASFVRAGYLLTKAGI